MELNMKDEGFRFRVQGSGLYSTSPVVRLPTVPGATAPCTNSFTSWTRNVVVYGDYIVLYSDMNMKLGLHSNKLPGFQLVRTADTEACPDEKQSAWGFGEIIGFA